jgi:gliding motility-associated-like protein
MTSISLPKTVTSFSNDVPPAISNITTSLNAEGTNASLLWESGAQPLEYSIFRNNNLLTTTTTEQFTDESYDLMAHNCYSISYKNQCNNLSSKTESCPIKLESTLQQDNSTILTWSAYRGWTNGVSNYIVEKYTAQGEFVGVVYSGPATTSTDNNSDNSNQSFYYVVKAQPNDITVNGPGASNITSIILDPKVVWPKAFTPDNKGNAENENFKPVASDYVDRFDMQIFNRWGELMFFTNDINQGWDGTYRGLPVPEGIYAYNANLTDNLGRKFTRSGSLILFRAK